MSKLQYFFSSSQPTMNYVSTFLSIISVHYSILQHLLQNAALKQWEHSQKIG